MNTITIYHNGQCGTSRNVLNAILAAGYQPNVIEYLKNPPDFSKLKLLIDKMNISPQQLLRVKGNEAKIATLQNLTDDDLINSMVQDPILINRPIVEMGEFVKLCRPSETIHEFLKAKVSK